MFAPFLRRWGLDVDGEEIVTPRARLLPVTRLGQPAMLKTALFPSEIHGNAVMTWWDGQGAARVLAAAGATVLLERAEPTGTLVRLYDEGRDAEAIAVIADVAAALHAPRTAAAPVGAARLSDWFVDLPPAAERLGGVLHDSATAAAELFGEATDEMLLHGDLHHDNILHFGERGWLAIDPKGVQGERIFEFVPQLFDPDARTALDVSKLDRQIGLTVASAGVDPARLRLWLLAWAGLLATWWSEDGKPPEPSLSVAKAVAATWPGADERRPKYS